MNKVYNTFRLATNLELANLLQVTQNTIEILAKKYLFAKIQDHKNIKISKFTDDKVSVTNRLPYRQAPILRKVHHQYPDDFACELEFQRIFHLVYYSP